jgi:hypothetical protein
LAAGSTNTHWFNSTLHAHPGAHSPSARLTAGAASHVVGKPANTRANTPTAHRRSNAGRRVSTAIVLVMSVLLPQTSSQQPVHIIVLQRTPIAFRIRRRLLQAAKSQSSDTGKPFNVAV